MKKKLRITTLLIITGLIVLSLLSFSKEQPPLMPMTIEGYVTIQSMNGTNMTAPAGLSVAAKYANTTTLQSNSGSLPTDATGYYLISVGSSDNTVPPDGTPIDIWVQNVNVTRTIFHYQTLLVLNLTARTSGWPEGLVDIRDVHYVALYYGTTPLSPNWNPNADINNDGRIDIRDVHIAAANYGQHYP